MANGLEVLMNRRSVRNFESKQISEEELNQILVAGLQAATAVGHQSWHFTVVQDQEFLKKISAAVASALYDSGVPSLQERASTNFQPSLQYFAPQQLTLPIADCANACRMTRYSFRACLCYIAHSSKGSHPIRGLVGV